MAIPDGKPATDFSAMNREWVRAVAEEAAESGGGGIPAPENPSDGDVLTYNSTSEEWEAATPAASGIPAPADPSDGDVLTYDSSEGEWVAAAPSGGGGALIITDTYDQLTGQEILSVTAQQIVSAMQTGPVIYMRTNIDDADPPTEYYWAYLSEYLISDPPAEHEYPYTFTFEGDLAFYANSLSDYPKNPGDPIPGE